VETRLIEAYVLIACLAVGAIVTVLLFARYQRARKRMERGHRRPVGGRKPFWF
jgi:hypothetical protein